MTDDREREIRHARLMARLTVLVIAILIVCFAILALAIDLVVR